MNKSPAELLAENLKTGSTEIPTRKIKTRLREIRETIGLSSIQVCYAIKVSQADMSRWENGKAYPSGESMILLCQFYNKYPHEIWPLGEENS